eukprot:1476887-Rhodomonas_salina.3
MFATGIRSCWPGSSIQQHTAGQYQAMRWALKGPLVLLAAVLAVLRVPPPGSVSTARVSTGHRTKSYGDASRGMAYVSTGETA